MAGGYEETKRLKKIACEGAEGNGEAREWRFAGQPTVRTTPRIYPPSGTWSPFPLVEFCIDGEWVESDEAKKRFSDNKYYESRLPGWHPAHCCGMFCDGQDGNGACRDEKMAGPPKKSPLQQLTEEVWSDV